MPKDFSDIPSTVANALERNCPWPSRPFAVWLPRIHWASVLVENYINARTMRILMEQKMSETIGAQINGESIAEDTHDRAFRSCTLAFYHFANTALNAAKELSDNATRSAVDDQSAKNLYKYRKSNQKGAKRIADIRNLIVCHPENTKNAAAISSWGSNCQVRVKVSPITYDLGESTEFILDPKNDLSWLHNYLNGLFPFLNKCLGIVSDDHT